METFADRLAASLARYGLAFVAGPTGGGCEALILDTADDGDWIVTNGDAQLPDGDGTTLVRRPRDGDDSIVWALDDGESWDVAGTAYRIALEIRRH